MPTVISDFKMTHANIDIQEYYWRNYGQYHVMWMEWSLCDIQTES